MTKRDLGYYKSLNYKMNFFYQEDEGRWYVEFPELRGCMADGANKEEAMQAAQETKDEWLETSYESDREIPEPRAEIEYSGRFLLRIPKSLHKSLAEEAEREGTSINRLTIQFLTEAMGRRQNLRTISDELKTFAQGLVSTVQKRILSRPIVFPRLDEATDITDILHGHRTTYNTATYARHFNYVSTAQIEEADE